MYRPHASRKTLSHYKCYRPSIETNNTVLNSPWYAGYSAIILWCDCGLVRMQYALIFIVIRPESRLAFFLTFLVEKLTFPFFCSSWGYRKAGGPIGELWNEWLRMNYRSICLNWSRMIITMCWIVYVQVLRQISSLVLSQERWCGLTSWSESMWYRGVLCKTKSEIVNEREHRYSS